MRLRPATSPTPTPPPVSEALFEGDARAESGGALVDRFIVPPFSILDGRSGYWQDRKRLWRSLGIEAEIGRGEGLTWGTSEAMTDLSVYARARREARAAAAPAHSRLALDARPESAEGGVMRGGGNPLPHWANNGTANMAPGTSLFDPVLSELACWWFSPPGGTVLDPYAGGSVRGLVAATLGHRYWGVDLSGRQVEANRESAPGVLANAAAYLNRPVSDLPVPRWIEGDSRDVLAEVLEPSKVDLIFTCPPYYDLEVYSDDERDLSNAASYEKFLAGYEEIARLAADRLRENRFVVYVVGDLRHKKLGHYLGLPKDTIAIHESYGLRLWNEAIYISPMGTLSMRADKSFVASRKLGRAHQVVLVFLKGDAREAARAVFKDGSEILGLPDPQLDLFDLEREETL